MKFIIDGTEIKTVTINALIEGSINSVSRHASFSYIYNPDDSEFKTYKAKIGSDVVIKNDSGKNIFKGEVTQISFQAGSNLIQIEAQDNLYKLLKTKLTGRFRGALDRIISKLISEFDISFMIISFLTTKINILNLGHLSIYDIIHIAVSKVFEKDGFKIYLDGDNKLKILTPYIDSVKREFYAKRDIIQASYSCDEKSNISNIKTSGDDAIVSGCVIRVIDNEIGALGDFIVESDRHTYSDIHLMELKLKERKISL